MRSRQIHHIRLSGISLTLLLATTSGCLDPQPAPEATTAHSVAATTSQSAPLLSTDTLLEQMQAGWEIASAPQIEGAFAAFDTAMTRADTTCPELETGDDGDTYFWFGDCAATSGAGFQGEGFSATLSEVEGNERRWGRAVEGSGQITDPAGFDLLLSGSFESGQELEEDWMGFYRAAFGSLISDGSTDPWLNGDISAALEVYTGRDRSGAGYYYSELNGALSSRSGTAPTMAFDQVVLQTHPDDSDCLVQATGLLALRDSNGTWYTLSLDAASYAVAAEGEDEVELEPTAAACDFCGELAAGETPLGSGCLEPGTLLTWEQAPW